jgi:hypothetical protein
MKPITATLQSILHCVVGDEHANADLAACADERISTQPRSVGMSRIQVSAGKEQHFEIVGKESISLEFQ